MTCSNLKGIYRDPEFSLVVKQEANVQPWSKRLETLEEIRLSPSPPSSVDCVELKLECRTSTPHRGEEGGGGGNASV